MTLAKSGATRVGIDSLRKRFGDFVALDGVSLDVAPGEFLTLLGPSGSGKTTLLMALAGFSRPDSGAVRFNGADITLLPPHRRDIGVVFQNYALFPHMTVAENVSYPLRLRGVRGADAARRVDEALALVKLPTLGGRRVGQLSGGQMQRVALARAIVFEPRILLMDEPLSALDKQLRESMQIELRALHERLGTTTIYVTHDQREALTMSDRIAVMNRGRIEQLDVPRAIYDRPATRFVAEFIGESSFLKVELQGGRVRWRGKEIPLRGDIPAGDCGYLVVRPEKLTRCPDAGERIEFFGTVADAIFQGETSLIQVDLGEGDVLSYRVIGNYSKSGTVGTPITTYLAAEDAVIVGTS
jgi:putative spermidine/putrescine transport system ATP-binding protein